MIRCSPRLRLLFTSLAWVAIGAGVLAAFEAGLALRRWTWEKTETIRWKSNVANAFLWGSRVLDGPERSAAGTGAPTLANLWSGYRTLYEAVEGSTAFPHGKLDYAPGRLLVAALWVRQIRQTEPGAARWQPQYTPFMLKLNTAAAGLAAVGAFLLVWHWQRVEATTLLPAGEEDLMRGGGGPAHPRWGPILCGLGAGLLLWFNAAVLLEAHGWPQWDIWPIPFYLFALYMASTNRWGRAGALVAAGALFKGQILFVAPFLMLWPLFQGKLKAAARCLLGFAVMGCVGGSPWLIPGRGSLAAVMAALLLAAGAAWAWTRAGARGRFSSAAGRAVAKRKWRARRGGSGAVGVEEADSSGSRSFTPIPAAPPPPAMPGRGEWARVRARVRLALTAAAGGFVLAVVLVAWLHPAASFAWLRVGYVTGTEKFPVISRNAAANLPAILGQSYRWRLNDVLFANAAGEGGMTLRTLLALCYGLTLVACAAGAARHAARGSRMFLVAAAAPWVLMFTLLGQMDGRYLLYGAAVSAVFAGVGVGFTLMHLLLTAMNFAMIFRFLVRPHARQWPEAARWVSGIEPGLGWAVVLAAAILLYASLIPSGGPAPWVKRRARTRRPPARPRTPEETAGPALPPAPDAVSG